MVWIRAAARASLLAMAGSVWFAPMATAESLASALADTYQLNQQIAAERSAVSGKDELIPEAKANLWRPHVTFQPQTSLTRTPSKVQDTLEPTAKPGESFTQNNDNLARDQLLQINAVMNVFDSGLTAGELRQAKALIEAERGILKQTEEQVFQNVALQYGQIVLNEMLAQYALETKQDTERLRTSVKALLDVHFVTVTAVSQLEEEYQNAVVSYEQAVGAIKAARAQFAAVVGRPAGKVDGWPKLDPGPAALEPALKIAFTENAQLATAQAGLAAARAAGDVAKAQLLPVVSVFGDVTRDWNSTHFLVDNLGIASGLPPSYQTTNSTSFQVGLRLTLPLYQGGAEYANVRQQLDTVMQNQRTVVDTQRSVRGAVEAAWQNLQSAQAQSKAAVAQVAASRLGLAGLIRQFQDGTETITDVLTQQRNLSSAESSEAQADYSYFTATVAFQVAIGRFTARGLHLPVQLYDPLDHYKAVKDKWFGFNPIE